MTWELCSPASMQSLAPQQVTSSLIARSKPSSMCRYANLLPWLLRMLPPDSPQLGRQLGALNDSEGLWSPAGLRSLSASSTLYQVRSPSPSKPLCFVNSGASLVACDSSSCA